MLPVSLKTSRQQRHHRVHESPRIDHCDPEHGRGGGDRGQGQPLQHCQGNMRGGGHGVARVRNDARLLFDANVFTRRFGTLSG